jgi:rubredoxin
MEDCCVICGYVFAPEQPVERTWDIRADGRLVQARRMDVPVDTEYHVCSACLPGFQGWLQEQSRAPH